MNIPEHVEIFSNPQIITTKESKNITVYSIEISDEEKVLNAWATHLRRHYCSDDDIDDLRNGYSYSREQYLNEIKFPDPTSKLGPSTMSGDFSEILVADYLEFVLKYFVPRTRYDTKINRNSSAQGSDLIGYSQVLFGQINKDDKLLVFEVKAQASDAKAKLKLQEAVNDSAKDMIRLAESLNASYQRLRDRKELESAFIVRRFQNATDTPYKKTYAAAAVHSDYSYSEELLHEVTIKNHPDEEIILLVIHSPNLMNFIRDMYRRASKC